jgi:hypothetical protein
MTLPLTVGVGPSDDPGGHQRAVLATMPATFRLVDGDGGDIRLVSGAQPDWPDAARAALGAGVAGVLVARPVVPDATALATLMEAERASTAVVAPDMPSVTDPTWTSVVSRVGESVREATLVEALAVVDSRGALDTENLLEAALLEQVALVRTVTAAWDDAICSLGELGFSLRAESAGVAIALSGAVSSVGPGYLQLNVRSPRDHWQARFDRGAPSAPARVVRFDAHGGEVQPVRYETGTRATWRQLAAAVRGDGRLAYGLGDLAGDVAAVDSLLSRARS